MNRQFSILAAALAVGVNLAIADIAAAEVYFKAPLRTLALTEGELPADAEPRWDQRTRLAAMRAYAVLDQEGEAYFDLAAENVRGWWTQQALTRDADLLIRATREGDVTGRLYVPEPDLSAMRLLHFSVPASQADAAVRDEFLAAKAAHYGALLERDIPGGAWFRHLAREARHSLPDAPADDQRPPWQDRRRPGDDLSDTYALFTGGRALSENLQFDRVLPPAESRAEVIDVDEIEGITVRELDWTALLGDAQPARDELARLIPADQHAVFFPNFEAATKLANEAAEHGTPILRLLEPRSESASVKAGYEQQLGIALDELSRMLGPTLISSVAMTGSDPYFRTGTDAALLFLSPQQDRLRTMLNVRLRARAPGSVLFSEGEIAGVRYASATTRDRRVCSYLASIGDAVVVANSLVQIDAIARTHVGSRPSIADLPEYLFFRSRYPLGEPETAFVFLSDATIRRWCGPRWRIATSRRIRDAGVMAELQAAHFEALARGELDAGPLHTHLPTAQIGDVRLTPQGIVSSTYNTLEFLTPIAEMEIERVSKVEAEAYRRWREGYQRNWSQFFDPIAARLVLEGDRLDLDLTVMPLVVGTDYAELISFARGGHIDPHAGDLHQALAHFIVAVNHESLPMRQAGNWAGMIAPTIASPLGWAGETIALYGDADPFWGDLADVPAGAESRFLQGNLSRLPVALRVAVKDRLGLAGFLTGLRAFIHQTAPGMTAWESLTHNQMPYVKVTATEQAAAEGMTPENLSIFYAQAGDGLVVTLNEQVLKSALERAGDQVIGDAAEEWLGSSVGLKVSGDAFELLARILDGRWRQMLQLQSWGNVPILTEWKRRFPDQDPVALHEKFWHVRLICPGGGEYIWNERMQTMESTAFGSPASPIAGPEVLPVFAAYGLGDFGLTFENDGLRARTRLTHSGR